MGEKPYHQIKINLLDEPIEINDSSQPLLNLLEAAKLQVPFHCREGFCGACRAKLISGKTEYLQEPLAFVREGEVLLCCSKVISDVEIEID